MLLIIYAVGFAGTFITLVTDDHPSAPGGAVQALAALLLAAVWPAFVFAVLLRALLNR
jgi:hypothetical protein